MVLNPDKYNLLNGETRDQELYLLLQILIFLQKKFFDLYDNLGHLLDKIFLLDKMNFGLGSIK